MNKIYTLFIGLSLLLMVGCKPASQGYYIGISQCSDDEWRDKMNHEMEIESWLSDNLTLEFKTSKDNTEQQRKDIAELVSKGVDLLIVSPNEMDALTTDIEKIYESGIPVIVVDRKINSEKFTAYLGADNYKIGLEAGKYVANLAPRPLKLVELTGLSNSTSATERKLGFKEAVGSKVQLIKSVDAEWLYVSAFEAMQTILKEEPEIDLVFAQNDRMAAAAYDAAKAVGREQDIQFIGVDGIAGPGYGIDLVLHKKLTATFVYPTRGDLIIKTALRILEGEPFKRIQLLPTSVIDGSNVEMVDLQTREMTLLANQIAQLQDKTIGYYEQNKHQKSLLWLAFIVVVIFILLLLMLFKLFRAKNNLNSLLSANNKALQQQKEKITNQRDQLLELSTQLEEASQAKVNFFTNVSHDFRTPLTLIIDPINHLLKGNKLDKEARDLLEMAQRNGEVLLRLIGQLLDFRKATEQKMDLNTAPATISLLFEGWNKLFTLAMQSKEITFNYINNTDKSFRADVDVEKLERIYYNLLSNAVKYTPKGGFIVVELMLQTETFTFSIFNSGSKIDDEQLQHLFEQFYTTSQQNVGTGIGLSVAKTFVDLHHGEISVTSTNDGTRFTVTLPLQQDGIVVKTSESLTSSLPHENEVVVATGLEEPISLNSENSDEELDKITLLIVDDNDDIRHYLHLLFKDQYIVVEAVDGEDGLSKAQTLMPDLIISDVMMPNMDGMAFCKAIKSDVKTSHIPVIMLTAKAMPENRVEGYHQGADSYLSKPFSNELIQARVENLLKQRTELRRYFGQELIPQPEEVVYETLDDQFIKQFYALVEQHLNDSSLRIEDLGTEMGFSRVQLYRKVKAITGLSPVDILRKQRLQRAYKMLQTKQYSVSQVCYEVGFTSPSYFSKSFKEEFNESPSEVLKG